METAVSCTVQTCTLTGVATGGYGGLEKCLLWTEMCCKYENTSDFKDVVWKKYCKRPHYIYILKWWYFGYGGLNKIYWGSTIAESRCPLNDMPKDDCSISQVHKRPLGMNSSLGCEFQVLLPASWLWVIYLISLNLNFLICKIEIIIVDTVIIFDIIIISYRMLRILKANACKEIL